MGQAAVDLPDPLEPPPATSAAGTDDLLAQLAGEEIDRLLAEAEVDNPSAPADDASPEADESAGDWGPTATPAQAASSTAGAANAPTAPPAAPIVIAPTVAQPEQRVLTPASKAAFAKLSKGADAGSEADEREKAGKSPNPVESEPAIAAPRPRIEEPAAAPIATTPAAQAEARVEAQTVAAAAAVEQSLATQTPGLLAELEEEERLAKAAQAALAVPVSEGLSTAGDTASRDADDDADLELDGEDEDGRDALPVYLKPLAWLNAPLEACPDSVRQAVGKVAIITLVNAIAVLLYVLIFRRG